MRQDKPPIIVPLAIALVLITLLCAVPARSAEHPLAPPSGMSREEAIKFGEAIYRDGILPSGEQVQAVVVGDIPVKGSMFSCSSCHMRSGLGSVEGTIISPPTNGDKLYKAHKSGQEFSEYQRKNLPAPFRMPDIRPAYTDKTLGEVLQTGIDPGGRELDSIMPRYMLAGRDLDILVYYLNNLSSEPSPGVTETTLRFATIVSDGVRKDDRDAMLLPLAAYLRDRRTMAPYYKSRTRSELFSEEMDLAYRGLTLATWLLKGPPETWRSQLDSYYKKEAVFAVLGGIVKGSWSPVHEFCEQNRIPCIFPITDTPVISDIDWYTLYFSKGPYQEGEAAAKFLKDKDGPMVQVFRRTDEGLRFSEGFRETRKEFGMPAAEEVELKAGEKIDESLWNKLHEQYKNGTLILWLNIDDLSRMARISGDVPPMTLITSATVLGKGLYSLPENLRQHTFITYPYRLPKDREQADHIVKPWLKVKKIPEKNLAVSSNMYFLGTLLTDVLMHMQRNYYRDHFLDVIDMLGDETDTIANYPRLSFGPGQRYASKGCYIVQLSSGGKPVLLKRSDWVVH